MQALQSNTLLQGGRYKIIKTLGQGGFGITYLAIQSGLDRHVAVKEFFMKELCERDETTSHVTLGTVGMREQVARFREKFLKEARNIAKLNHPHIVRIIDVFEENGTAYYVMEYAEGSSLAEKINKEGYLSENKALRYMGQVADALDYIHQHKMNHLDVKPGNIMLTENDDAVLIDFGLSKQYDATTGNQTSTTPVGISEGYAPMEQYKQGGVSTFTPETDIYALGATFFKLLTGLTPPSASDVMEDGVPITELEKKGINQSIVDLISHAMEARKKDRIHSVAEFKARLSGTISAETPTSKEETIISRDVIEEATVIVEDQQEQTKKDEKLTFTVNGVSFDMMRVEAGTFMMGDTPEMHTLYYREPVHQVTLTEDYYIGKTVVTQALWKAVMGKEMKQPSFLGKLLLGEEPTMCDNNPARFKGDQRPIEKVSWEDCQTFITKLNDATGKNFRLPTEAEWEFAARGGNKSNHYQYSGSNNIEAVAWYEKNAKGETHDVATKQPNELGIYDMSGNVWEWCQDWYGSYSSDSQTNPQGPAKGACLVSRGGSWYNYSRFCRSSNRSRDNSEYRSSDLGFRLCLSE